MAINIELPKLIEDKLRTDLRDFSAVAKEAMLVELYRQSRLTHRELSDALNLTRFETDGVLKQHNVTEDLLTPEEYESELGGLGRLVNG